MAKNQAEMSSLVRTENWGLQSQVLGKLPQDVYLKNDKKMTAENRKTSFVFTPS